MSRAIEECGPAPTGEEVGLDRSAGVVDRGGALLTGTWRVETIGLGGVAQIGGRHVAAGDLVLADDTGVCFVPRDKVAEVYCSDLYR